MKLSEVLDKLKECVQMTWVPDRIGGYSTPQLNRRKAAKIIREAIDNGDTIRG